MCDGSKCDLRRRWAPRIAYGPQRSKSHNRWLARRVSLGGSALVIGPHWKGGDDRFGVREAAIRRHGGNRRRRSSVVLTLRVRMSSRRSVTTTLGFRSLGRAGDERLPDSGSKRLARRTMPGPAPVACSGKTRDASRSCCQKGPRPMAAARSFFPSTTV